MIVRGAGISFFVDSGKVPDMVVCGVCGRVCSLLLDVVLSIASGVSIRTCTGMDNVGCQGPGFLAIARRRLGSITIYDPHVVVKPTILAFVAKSEQYTD